MGLGTKISALVTRALANLTGNEYFPITYNGINYKVLLSDLKTWITAAVSEYYALYTDSIAISTLQTYVIGNNFQLASTTYIGDKAGKFQIDSEVRIASLSIPTAYIEGSISTYNTSTGLIVIKVTKVGVFSGSTPINDWVVTIPSVQKNLFNDIGQVIIDTSTGTVVFTYSKVPVTNTDIESLFIDSSGNISKKYPNVVYLSNASSTKLIETITGKLKLNLSAIDVSADITTKEFLIIDSFTGIVTAIAAENIFAKRDLSNLASTAVNADIIPVTDNTKVLGATAKNWKDIWINNFKTDAAFFNFNSKKLSSVANPVAATDALNLQTLVNFTNANGITESAGQISTTGSFYTVGGQNYYPATQASRINGSYKTGITLKKVDIYNFSAGSGNTNNNSIGIIAGETITSEGPTIDQITVFSTYTRIGNVVNLYLQFSAAIGRIVGTDGNAILLYGFLPFEILNTTNPVKCFNGTITKVVNNYVEPKVYYNNTRSPYSLIDLRLLYEDYITNSNSWDNAANYDFGSGDPMAGLRSNAKYGAFYNYSNSLFPNANGGTGDARLTRMDSYRISITYITDQAFSTLNPIYTNY